MLACVASAAHPAARTAPSRPDILTAPQNTAASLPTRKFGQVDYVDLTAGAARLGLKVTWLERGKRLALAGAGTAAEVMADTRDARVNGLRVFLGDPPVGSGGSLLISRIDFERSLTPLLRPGFGVTVLPVPRTVVLDPGHGGNDTGTSENEKGFALEVAQRARKVLEAAGYRVVLTRERDVFLGFPRGCARGGR